MAAAALSALVLAGAAHASLPPRKPLTVDLARQSVGSLSVGDPAVRFAFAWAPPDFGMPSSGDVVPEAFQSWRNPPAAPWAVVSFTADDQQHATAIFYRGPFRTTKGDVNGTTLAVVLRHWPSHGPSEPFAAQTPSLLRLRLRVRVGSSSFFFDAKKRLLAVQVGEGSASRWIDWKH